MLWYFIKKINTLYIIALNKDIMTRMAIQSSNATLLYKTDWYYFNNNKI